MPLPTHGSAADRGSADAYYHRPPHPHIWHDGLGSRREELAKADPRWQEYMDAYSNEDDRKDWT